MDWKNFKYLTDENIDLALVSYLRGKTFDVKSVFDLNLQGKTDVEILQKAVEENRIVLTHDSDFGTLIFKDNSEVIGIIYLRPGHIDVSFTISTLETIFASDLEPSIPFVLIAQQTGSTVKIRLRNL